MVVLFLLDVAALLYPPDLMNPEWEFETAGNIIERIVVPIMGLGFIFFGETYLRRKWELLLLKGLSWTSLVCAAILIVGIPLILVTSSQRIALLIDENFGNQYRQQVSQAEVIQEQIESASRSDLEALITAQGAAFEGSSPEEARRQLLDEITNGRRQLQTQVQEEINQRKDSVKKNAAKWILGSIVSGFLLAYIWHLTQWSRLLPKGALVRKPRTVKA